MFNMCRGSSPFTISASSKGWKKDINALGPWDHKNFISDSFSFDYYISADHLNHHEVFIFDECPSVMDLVPLFHQFDLIADWGSVVSVSQTRGRGRFGRKWGSPAGNLHVAFLLPELPEEFLNLDAIITSVIIIEYFTRMGICADLKWPNDLVVDGKKIAGLLVEKKMGLNIVGIGVNLSEYPDEEMMRNGYAFPAGIISPSDHLGGPLGIWIDMLGYMRRRIYEIIYSSKVSDLISMMEDRLLWKGKDVMVLDTSEGDMIGEILGLGRHGGLRILVSGHEKEIFSGTVIRSDY